MKSNRFSSVHRIKFNNIYFDVAVTFLLTCFSLFLCTFGVKRNKRYAFFSSQSQSLHWWLMIKKCTLHWKFVESMAEKRTTKKQTKGHIKMIILFKILFHFFFYLWNMISLNREYDQNEPPQNDRQPHEFKKQ